ncbi:hypothetical protein LSH36_199g02015 [Paralvinella palmiformis]|uniref:Uncharacterized protein n=1 Tax=Paralvinella palmiformis TaxID=53620 RepID=A0AAD9JPZ0_9ANNE|nr:hypothetical protein LSH36_199g02015 [Paralvinella palmiformis]
MSLQILFGILIFATFSVDIERIQNRLLLSFILLLSNITFKFNISKKRCQKCPISPYQLASCVWSACGIPPSSLSTTITIRVWDRTAIELALVSCSIKKKGKFFQDKDGVPKNSVTKF